MYHHRFFILSTPPACSSSMSILIQHPRYGGCCVLKWPHPSKLPLVKGKINICMLSQFPSARQQGYRWPDWFQYQDHLSRYTATEMSVIFMKFLSLAATEVVVMTVSDENFIKMTLSFQCIGITVIIIYEFLNGLDIWTSTGKCNVVCILQHEIYLTSKPFKNPLQQWLVRISKKYK